ncbi:MAG: LURP-one-related family protein, partial [Actinomycetota bacterium]
MNYPLSLSFKLLALASQIYVRDANGNLLGYVKQKMFKLKDDINVFADEKQTQLLFNIKADKMIDWSANFSFTDARGNFLGSIKRQGMRSIWKASYDIFDSNGNQVMKIHEENGWIKVGDALFGELPLVGILSGYVFNPAYIVERTNGTPIARLKKQPAFFEGKFLLE